jgi:hypothetical protein
MKIDGTCHCGDITYEADIDPDKIVICHCTDCQTLSGSAFRTVAVTRENGFRLLSGELKVYVKIAESGKPRQQSFCPRCGSPVYSADEGDQPKTYAIRIGTARQRDQLIPKAQIWNHSAQHWLEDLGDISKIDLDKWRSR